MDWSTPGLLLFHHLSEFAQTSVHWVKDAIQPSWPLSPPTVPALNSSQHHGLFKLQYTVNTIFMYTAVYCGICFIIVVWIWTLNISDVCLYTYMCIYKCQYTCMCIYVSMYTNKIYKTMCVCVCVCVCMLSLFSWVQLFVNLWTIAHKALLSMGFSSHEYWSGFPFLLQGIFLIQGANPYLLHLLNWRQILYC